MQVKAEQAADNRKERQAHELLLKFPCHVKQLGPDVVVIELGAETVSPVTVDMEVIAPDLSGAEQDRLFDDITHYAVSQGLIRSIRML